MGTNYYLHTDFCQCCGKPKSIIHIGKCSAGWKFLFYKGDNNSIEDVKSFIKTGVIFDEYERQVSEYDFWKMVEDKQKDKNEHQNDEYTEQIDGYDFCSTEFS